MNIWLDDERDPKNYVDEKEYLAGLWVWVKTADEVIALLESGKVDMISLDHDLGGEKTGYDVAKWIEASAYVGGPRLRWFIHTANPVGYYNIMGALLKAERYWLANEGRRPAKEPTVEEAQ